MSEPASEKNVIARNRRATHDYEIVERLEAGIALLGPEVKSLRAGKVSLAEAYGSFIRGELYIVDMTIPEYTHKGYALHDPTRRRKLLVHRREAQKWENSVTRRGLTVIPIQIYFLKGRAKIEIGLARGRKRHDKREAARTEEARREARSAEGRKR